MADPILHYQLILEVEHYSFSFGVINVTFFVNVCNSVFT